MFWSSDFSLEKLLMPEKLRTEGEEGIRGCPEMAEQHHQYNEHELGQTLGDSDGQGGLVCCSPWRLKESDTTEWLNNNNSCIALIFLPQVHIEFCSAGHFSTLFWEL